MKKTIYLVETYQGLDHLLKIGSTGDLRGRMCKYRSHTAGRAKLVAEHFNLSAISEKALIDYYTNSGLKDDFGEEWFSYSPSVVKDLDSPTSREFIQTITSDYVKRKMIEKTLFQLFRIRESLSKHRKNKSVSSECLNRISDFARSLMPFCSDPNEVCSNKSVKSKYGPKVIKKFRLKYLDKVEQLDGKVSWIANKSFDSTKVIANKGRDSKLLNELVDKLRELGINTCDGVNLDSLHLPPVDTYLKVLSENLHRFGDIVEKLPGKFRGEFYSLSIRHLQQFGPYRIKIRCGLGHLPLDFSDLCKKVYDRIETNTTWLASDLGKVIKEVVGELDSSIVGVNSSWVFSFFDAKFGNSNKIYVGERLWS